MAAEHLERTQEGRAVAPIVRRGCRIGYVISPVVNGAILQIGLPPRQVASVF